MKSLKVFPIRNLWSNKVDLLPTNHVKTGDQIFHKLTLAELAQLLNTSFTFGLDEACAQQLLAKNGKNHIKPKGRNILWRMLSYLFTGFCGLLWISSLICLLAWKPIGNSHSSIRTKKLK
jgi:hypothetical protein